MTSPFYCDPLSTTREFRGAGLFHNAYLFMDFLVRTGH